jgi:hypothetical protein
VPAWQVQTSTLYSASDNAYADIDPSNGETPDVAIGRLPVETPAQATLLVQKILDYEDQTPTADWARKVLLVSDQPTTIEPFDLWSRSALPDLGPGYSLLELVRGGGLDDPALRTTLAAEWDEGALVTTWFGHGATGTWALGGGSVFTTADATARSNASRLPLVVTASCLNSLFQYPYLPSMAEALLLVPSGGAVAFVGPTALERGVLQQYLLTLFYDHLFCDGKTVAEALRDAKRDALGLGSDFLDAVRSFVLLGDPALRLR